MKNNSFTAIIALFAVVLFASCGKDAKVKKLPQGMSVLSHIEYNYFCESDSLTNTIDYEIGEMNSSFTIEGTKYPCTIFDMGPDSRNHSSVGTLERYSISFREGDTIVSRCASFPATELNSDHYFYYINDIGRAEDNIETSLGVQYKDVHAFTDPKIPAAMFWFKQ